MTRFGPPNYTRTVELFGGPCDGQKEELGWFAPTILKVTSYDSVARYDFVSEGRYEFRYEENRWSAESQ